jgi:hypothetical protein
VNLRARVAVLAHGPAERLRKRRLRPGDPAPERAPRGPGLVDDRDQLEVGIAASGTILLAVPQPG